MKFSFLFFIRLTKLTIAYVLVTALTLGCEPKTGSSLPAGTLQVIDPVSLQNELQIEIGESMAMIAGTTTEIAAGTQDRNIRENTLRLKIRVLDIYLKILKEDDPRLAFVYTWTSTAQLRQYLTEGRGQTLFGPAQAQAVALAKTIEANIIALGEKHFSQQAIQQAAPEIEETARSFLLNASFVSEPTAAVIVGRNMMNLAKLPLLPVTSLKRVSETPDAINRFTDIAKDFSVIVEYLPERLRWQMELLMMETESSGPVVTISQDFQRFEQTMRDISSELRTIPVEIRKEFEQSLTVIENTQPQLRETLREARAVAEQAQAVAGQTQKALETAQDTTRQAQNAADNFTQTAHAFEVAVKECRALLADFDTLRQSAAAEQPAADKGAAVSDYQAAAENFTTAAREIRSLLSDLQKPWPEHTGLKQTTTEFKKLIDTLFWRLCLLLVVGFLLAAVYRWITRHHMT